MIVGIEIHQHRMRERGAAGPRAASAPKHAPSSSSRVNKSTFRPGPANRSTYTRSGIVVSTVNAGGTNHSMNDSFSCAYARFARARNASSAMGAFRRRCYGVLTPWTPWLLLMRLRRSRSEAERAAAVRAARGARRGGGAQPLQRAAAACHQLSSRGIVREVADRERIGAFMTALARHATADADVFLVGGTRAVVVGWRVTTIDVDLVMRPEADAMLRAIPMLKK